MIRLTIHFIDGTSESCEATAFMSMADRIAFEQKYGQSASVMSKFAPGEDGETPDFSELREEWIAFFAWRELRRHGHSLDFEAFVDRLARVEFAGQPEAPGVAGNGVMVHENPSVPDPQLTS